MTTQRSEARASAPLNLAAPRAGTRAWIGLAVLVLPLLLIAVDAMVLMFALPAIAAELNPTGVETLWMVDVYSLMLAGLLITMGSVGDRIGRRRLLMLGAAGFAAASILGAVATAPWMLIAARALLGIAGATMMPTTLSLIRSMFPSRDERRTAVAVWAAAATVGAAGGPIVGGWLIENFSWHAAFAMNIPVMLLLLVLAPIFVPESRNPVPGPVDPAGILLSIAGMASAVYGIKSLAHNDPVLGGIALAIGLLLLLGFVLRQLRSATPAIDVRLFTVRAFAGAVAVDFLSVFAMIGALFALTQYLQQVAGIGPMTSALWLIPQAVLSAVAGLFAARLVRRFSAAWLVTSGVLSAASGFVLLLFLTAGSGPVPVSIALALIGWGTGVSLTLTNDIIMSSVRPEQAGQAAAIGETAYELGTALGAAVLGSVVLSTYHAAVVTSDESWLSQTVLDQAGETLAGALNLADRLGGHAGEVLHRLAVESFSHAVTVGSALGLALMVAAAVVARVALQGVRADQDLTVDH